MHNVEGDSDDKEGAERCSSVLLRKQTALLPGSVQ